MSKQTNKKLLDNSSHILRLKILIQQIRNIGKIPELDNGIKGKTFSEIDSDLCSRV